MSVKEDIKRSKAFLQYKRILKSIQEELDVVKLADEAKALHSGRKSRFLDRRNLDPKTLVEANLQDVANRSRLVEIIVQLNEHASNLETTVKAVRRHLLFEYGDRTGIGAVRARSAYFDRYFREGEQFLAEVDNLLKSIDHYIKDIDQTGFALKRSVDILQLIYKPERSL